ncbi:hypothetical protein GYRE_02460 [Yokenella regensburgei ATCC 49455]|jgi:transcriptional regulator with XRE-family HTH domain|uniref:HTH cro/C1-type domain-containing protein n=2 Tax=Yokenella regensburgei TaxID=158877 RepID=A0AB38G2Z7_9ENTR|nr:toxin-antitoxin system, antitoxin component, Xre family [Yokenella regensburgei ATCC 43003]KFD23213.1 hypothetical protein GYRE_02460 [Yokenella regensburgei ATCC 49455]SQA65368.1 Uncharacterised protein [Yokenella regensburgei]SQA95819.1 Uncharacterised protein [Yokenella regensburgei]SUQ03944.1 Uncharacterised protein [Yokenella regensburgei]
MMIKGTFLPMNDFTRAMTDSVLAERLFNRLEARRKAMKITQLTLAERVGITPKTYRAVKSGSCSLLIFISILRELQLLENLDTLVPAATLRPAEVWAQVSRAGKRQPSTATKAMQIRSMMEKRKKYKTGE